MKHILLTILVMVVFWLGKTFALILILASPDNIAHILHGSIFVLGSSIFIFSIYYTIEDTLYYIMKWILSILGIYGVLNTLWLSYAVMFSNQIQDSKDMAAVFSTDFKYFIGCRNSTHSHTTICQFR